MCDSKDKIINQKITNNATNNAAKNCSVKRLNEKRGLMDGMMPHRLKQLDSFYYSRLASVMFTINTVFMY